MSDEPMSDERETRAQTTTTGDVRKTLSAYAAAEPTLRLLVFLGSSSRGDASGSTEFEIAYLAERGFDAPTFEQLSASVLNLDRVAMSDLRRNSSTAFRAAREGALVYQRSPNGFAEFRERTIHNWCEVGPVLNAVYDRIESRRPKSPPQ